jgi:hypothetical protein
MELKEIFSDGELKLEERKKDSSVLAKLYFPWIVADKENSNKRTYPESIVKREVGKWNKKVQGSAIPGMLDHPIGAGTKLSKTSHLITKLEYDPKTKTGYAEAQVLNTSSGRDMFLLIKKNLKGLGASLRGLGNVKDGTVQDDFELITVDVVDQPSFGSATGISSENLYESGNQLFFEKDKKKVTPEEFNKQVKVGLEAAFRVDEQAKDWAKFVDENTERMVEIVTDRYKADGADLSLIFEEEETEEEKNRKEQNRLMALFRDAQRAGYRGTLKEYKEKFGDVISEKK